MVKKLKRRARNAKAQTIQVESDWVHVVPVSVARSYFRWEIENEGDHRTGCTPIVLFPRSEAGEGSREWVEKIFAAMDEVRHTHAKETIEMPSLVWDDTTVDVGLIDIPITFRGDLSVVASNLTHCPSQFFDENLRHIDRLFAGTFDDQMTLVSVLHAARTDGSPELHYHNLVFGVRREFRSGQALVGPLDFQPMLATLARELRVAVIGCNNEGWKVAYG